MTKKKIEELTRKEAWEIISKLVKTQDLRFSKHKEIIKELIFLHLNIESLLTNIVVFGYKWKIKNYNDIDVNIIEELDYKSAARICLLLGFIDKKTYLELKKFNSTRNKVAHRLIKEIPRIEDLNNDLVNGKAICKKIEDIFLRLNDIEAFGDIMNDTYESFKMSTKN